MKNIGLMIQQFLTLLGRHKLPRKVPKLWGTCNFKLIFALLMHQVCLIVLPQFMIRGLYLLRPYLNSQ